MLRVAAIDLQEHTPAITYVGGRPLQHNPAHISNSIRDESTVRMDLSN